MFQSLRFGFSNSNTAALDGSSCVSVPPVCYEADLQLCQEMPLDLCRFHQTSKFLKLCHFGKDSFSNVRCCDLAIFQANWMHAMQTSLIVAQKVHSIMATMYHIQHTRRQSTITRHFSKHHGLGLIVICWKPWFAMFHTFHTWWGEGCQPSTVTQSIAVYLKWPQISNTLYERLLSKSDRQTFNWNC